uniref:NADH dehydrogenase subunit 6 n=1 Tax=Apatidelia acuminata TaxID=1842858 RepID=UPI0022DCDC2D|nr:NADH dehydrogenase subunit 6 [Apatidelia acuminata]UZZ43776.1 NADH dehydrogenase subunit 6 [Apatidelia acuminata]
MLKLKFLFMLFAIISFWLINITHPLIITIFIIIQTVNLTMITGMISYSFWMSYIMFLVFIGGLLILFIYISSLIPNKNFSLNYKILTMTLIIMFLIILTMKIFPTFMNNEMIQFMNMMSPINEENSIFITNFYNVNEKFMTFILMNYLLLSLIITTKITSLNSGPMRNKTN